MKSIAGMKDVVNSESVLWQTWYSVPLLTAFGNAPNEHNNNSSRFGKLLQLQWNDGQIVGAFIKTFLLEKCRVSGPNLNEGNFHIFRQILDSLDPESLSNLYLDPEIIYKIAPPSDNIIRSTYAETAKSLKMLNINELNEIMIILAIILNLGNVAFITKDDHIHIGRESQKFLCNTSKLLKIEPEALIKLLVTKTFVTKARDSIYTSLCSNKEECYERRNCLMRYLYNNLFLWLIDRVNEQIYYPENDYKLLGILDIYGFEVFESNTFEQLCINYANERLQQFFVCDHLLKQKRDLESEGFFIENIDTSSYSQRIDLLDGNVSIFGVLNEECTMKRFNTDVFVNARLSETFKTNKYFEKSANNFSTIFVIKHFAGDVAYNTKTMLFKNRDKIPDEMIGFLKECKFPFLECILETNKLTNKTSLGKFKKSLDDLINILNESDVHYIKCLKPNNIQLSGFVDELFLNNQLHSNGIIDILKLQFQNFFIKLPVKEFLKSVSKNTFNILEIIFKESIHVGNEFIYLTEDAYFGFEILKCVERSSAARKVQRCWINYVQRRKTILTIQQFENKNNIIEEMIDLRKTSSEVYITRDDSSVNLTDHFTTSCMKAEEYLRVHYVRKSYEGEPLSLCLEKIFNNVETKKFKRVLFFGDRIISYNRLAEIPVRLHLSKSCIPYSNLLPKSELAKGLTDIF
ncbi:unconventional myosin-XIX-like [Onthophagus taurus]|uniref:unconventional myosin-XIX-like n=1 Tax=Onthophagus taurus TaxID=166361 RepID=UPI0039BEC101